jgi:4-carboxymuconolactone decarboxylase
MARIDPIPPGRSADDVRIALQGWMRSGTDTVGPPLSTLARHPDLAQSFLGFNRHLLFASTLTPRVRELAILRTSAVCDCPFERVQHVMVARLEGIDDDTIERTAAGPGADGWTPEDLVVIRATDELLAAWTLDDDTWAALAELLDEHQLMDFVFTVGSYAMFAMACKSFGILPE